MCQQSLLGRLSSEEEDDILSDGAELSCVFQMSNVRWRALVFDIAVSCVAHSCSVLSLSPIKDELPQYGEVVMGDMYRYRNDSSKLTHAHFVGRFSCVCFIVRAGGFSPRGICAADVASRGQTFKHW